LEILYGLKVKGKF